MRRAVGGATGALLAPICTLLLGSVPARAGFESGIVPIHATEAHIPLVSACTDGDRGAIVVWQENTGARGGVLRATHVLATGAMDGRWGDGVTISSVGADRSALGAVTDAHGGAYIWWSEQGTLFMTRVARDGTMAAGWPAAGLAFGTTPSGDRPQLLEDGTGGVYAGWFEYGTRLRVLAIHVGPDGHGAAGWPDRPIAYEDPMRDALRLTPSFALAADGGLWATWLDVAPESTGDEVVFTGGYRAAHVRASGAPAAGWRLGGSEVLPLADALDDYDLPRRMRPVAIAGAGDGGFYLVSFPSRAALQGLAAARLDRFTSAGGRSSDWPADGFSIGASYYGGAAVESSPRIQRLADGSLQLAEPGFGTEGFEAFSFERRTANGAPLSRGSTVNRSSDLRLHISSQGEVAWAYAQPFGWHNVMVGDVAALKGHFESAGQPPAEFREYQYDLWTVHYGAADIVLTGDGAAILVWSQDTDRHGLQAKRLGPPIVLDAPPTPVISAPSLRARFVRGEGVHAVASLPGASHVDLVLHDLAGRRIAGVTSGAPGAEVVFPGTRELPGGVYFARASDGTRELRSKVVVLP